MHYAFYPLHLTLDARRFLRWRKIGWKNVCKLWLEERTPEQLKGEGGERHVERTGEVKGKKAGNVFVDNALKASTSPRIPRLLSRENLEGLGYGLYAG